MDEIGFWERELSSDEISELYNSGSGFAYPFNVVPLQVENLTAETFTATTINVSWDYNGQTDGGVNITVGGTIDGSVVYPISSYNITGLKAGTEYNITALATNSIGTNITNSTENNILGTTINTFSVGWDGLAPENNTFNINNTMAFYFNFSGTNLGALNNCTFYENGTQIGASNGLSGDTNYQFTATQSPILEANYTYYVQCLSDTGLGDNTTTKTLEWSLLYGSITTNLSTSIISHPTLSFDINVSINGGNWDESPTCQMVDNVSWVSCLPATDVISLSVNETTFTCTASERNTGDVLVYANCSSTLYPLTNSSSYVYSFKDYDSIITDSILWLPFNNTIQDYSVNLVDTWMETSGIVTTPSYGIGHNGINNDALSTSVDDYLRFNTSDISYSATSTMTFWANAYTNYTSAGELVHSKFGKVSYNSSNALLSYSVNDTTTLKTIVYPINLTGSYNFISVVCDSGTSTMSLYINATLVNSSGSTTCTEYHEKINIIYSDYDSLK